MSDHEIRPLTADTWDAFLALCEKHNGIWNGCYCTWFHAPQKAIREVGGREFKRERVLAGQAHAALVFDGDAVVGWCEYGSPDELPQIYHRKEYLEGLTALPDYRITCFFVDRDHRGQGVAERALHGALDLIAAAGGGTVEGYPHDLQGGRMSSSFLYNGTRTLFERAGFEFERPKGKKNCVTRRTVEPAPATTGPGRR